MVYDHKVKHNGILYLPGEDVPVGEKQAAENAGAVEEHSPPPFSEKSKEKRYTKTEINRMNTADLQSLAAESGIENAYEKSGADLKKIFIEYFRL